MILSENIFYLKTLLQKNALIIPQTDKLPILPQKTTHDADTARLCHIADEAYLSIMQ